MRGGFRSVPLGCIVHHFMLAKGKAFNMFDSIPRAGETFSFINSISWSSKFVKTRDSLGEISDKQYQAVNKVNKSISH